MGINRDKHSWFKANPSAIYIGMLLVAGFLLTWGGWWFSQTTFTHPVWKTIAKNLAGLLPALSGSLIAGGLVAIFLSFRDVQEQLAKIFSTSLSDGSMVELLSTTARESFEEQIILAKLSTGISELDPLLLDHFRKVYEKCFKMIHIENYKVKEDIAIGQIKKDLSECTITISFRAKAYHINNKPAILNYRMLHESRVSDNPENNTQKYIYDLNGYMGDVVLGENNIKRIPPEKKENCKIIDEIKADVPIEGEINCRFQFKMLRPTKDNTTACFARYPTRGFEYEVRFDEKYDYDGYFFRGKEPEFGDFPGLKNVREFPNGISIETFDWVLPGEGGIIQWLPKT